MYVPYSETCDLPNSETPMSQAQIAAQAARLQRVGSKFIAGNQAMSTLVAALTPPIPTGTCADLTSSLAMRSAGRFVFNPFAKGRFALPPAAPPSAGNSPLLAAAGTAAAALLLPVPASIPASTPGSTAGAAPAPNSGGAGGPAGTPFNNTGWPIGGASPSGVEYPSGGVQRTLQMIVPMTCPPTPGATGLNATIAGVPAGWWLGLGLAALALLALGGDQKK